MQIRRDWRRRPLSPEQHAEIRSLVLGDIAEEEDREKQDARDIEDALSNPERAMRNY